MSMDTCASDVHPLLDHCVHHLYYIPRIDICGLFNKSSRVVRPMDGIINRRQYGLRQLGVFGRRIAIVTGLDSVLVSHVPSNNKFTRKIQNRININKKRKLLF